MSLLKSILKGFGALLALLAVLVVAVLGYNMFLMMVRSNEARDSAEAFCARFPAGTPIQAALTGAEEGRISAVRLPNGTGYTFQFMYFLSGWGYQVTTVGDTITNTAIVSVQ